MAEPASKRERLASTLGLVVTALRDADRPAAKTNGHGHGYDEAAVRKMRKTPATLGDVLDTARDVYREAGAAILEQKNRITELEQRLVGLEKRKGLAPLAARLSELEATQLTDGGVWSEGASYRKNAVVTHGGNLWLCKQENLNEKPPSDCWRLMNKTKAHL